MCVCVCVWVCVWPPKEYTYAWRCSCCNGYRHRKWTWRHVFKSCTRLIAFNIALVPLGKV